MFEFNTGDIFFPPLFPVRVTRKGIALLKYKLLFKSIREGEKSFMLFFAFAKKFFPSFRKLS